MFVYINTDFWPAVEPSEQAAPEELPEHPVAENKTVGNMAAALAEAAAEEMQVQNKDDKGTVDANAQ